MNGNARLVDSLIRAGSLRTPELIAAFLRCDRSLFVPPQLLEEAYGDYPLPLGFSQTISQPTTVAIMLELLSPRIGDRVLDHDSGSGRTTALVGCAGEETRVVEGVERISELVEFGRRNLERAAISNASIDPADPAALGKPGMLYDRILVSAAAPRMPRTLLRQLKPGGVLVLPVRESLWRIVRHADGSVASAELPGFRFVSLVIPEGKKIL